MLSLLLRARDEDGQPMTDVELRDELFTMLGAGHETTATGLAFAFELLRRNPRALARLREEIAVGEDDTYLDAVVKETLRLRPVIDAVERTLTKPRTVAGWELPAGHQGLPGDRAGAHARGPVPRARTSSGPSASLEDDAESYSWLPFGGGIRRCIGAALAQAEMAEVLRVVGAGGRPAAAARRARPGGPARDHAGAQARGGGDGCAAKPRGRHAWREPGARGAPAESARDCRRSRSCR